MSERIVHLSMVKQRNRHEHQKFAYESRGNGNPENEFAVAAWSSHYGWRGWVFRPLGNDPDGYETLISVENGIEFNRDGLGDAPEHYNDGAPCEAHDLTDAVRNHLKKQDYRIIEDDQIVRVMKMLRGEN